MDYKRFLKLTPIAASMGLAMGLSGNAQADAYAYSYLDIDNLTTTFTCSNTGVGCGFGSTDSEFFFLSYTSKSESTANWLGNGPGGTTAAQTSTAVVENGTITSFNVLVPGFESPAGSASPDSPASYEGLGAAPTNNEWAQRGEVDGAYARGDADQPSTQVGALVGQGPGYSQAIAMGESFVSGNQDAATAGGGNNSTTSAELAFAVADSFTIGFDFSVDTYMDTFIDSEGLSGVSNITLSFTLEVVDPNTGLTSTVFSWSPDGVDNNTANFNDDEDAFDTTFEVVDTVPADGERTQYDESCPPVAATCFSGVSNDLGPGFYKLVLSMSASTLVVNDEVPAPGTLALIGLGLLGATRIRRRNKRA